MNATCPFCGLEELRGTVEDITGGVPLFHDGYISEGNSIESEVTYIECASCRKAVDPHHYYCCDGEPCDCQAAVRAAHNPDVTPAFLNLHRAPRPLVVVTVSGGVADVSKFGDMDLVLIDWDVFDQDRDPRDLQNIDDQMAQIQRIPDPETRGAILESYEEIKESLGETT